MHIVEKEVKVNVKVKVKIMHIEIISPLTCVFATNTLISCYSTKDFR
jgi:hypothetical protein